MEILTPLQQWVAYWIRKKDGKQRVCKKCKSHNVAPVEPFVEHCRDCGNWQASF